MLIVILLQHAKEDKRSDEGDEEDNAGPDRLITPTMKRTASKRAPLPFALDAKTWGEGVNTSELTNNELQIAKYLNEILSHGVRTHASGFLLEDTLMSLWYADRMGLIQSVQFDIFKEPHYLLLVVAAHHYNTPREFGRNPLITNEKSHQSDVIRARELEKYPRSEIHCKPLDEVDEEEVSDNADKKTPRRSTLYEDAILTLPHAVPTTFPPADASADVVAAYDADGLEAIPHLDFQVSLDGDRRIDTAYGTIGRGTTVLPVIPGGRAALLFGHGRHVAKMAWPLEDRPAEDSFIRIIRRKLNQDDATRQYLKNIVDLRCSYSCDAEDPVLELPRAMLGSLPGSGSLRRCFRVLVMPEYLPLERIRGPEDLAQIFRDVVTGMY